MSAVVEEPELYCCWGALMDGSRGCTCWVPAFDLEQLPIQEGPVEVRAKCCGDCAFRQGSPEREDEYGFESIAHTPLFFCHQGVPRAVEYRHPDGHVREGDAADYRPVKGPERIWRADGRPGQLCAGWAAHQAGRERDNARFFAQMRERGLIRE